MLERKKTILELWSLRLGIAVQLAICALIFILIISPGTILSMLNTSRIQVSEVEIFGVSLKIDSAAGEEIHALRSKLSETLDEAGTLRSNLESSSILINCLARQICTENQKTEIKTLIDTQILPTEEPSILTELQETVIEEQDPEGSWIIVVGADKTLPSAQHELSKVMDAGFDGQIVRRGSWLRTIARFPDSASAKSAEPQIRDAVNRKVYVLPFSEWCIDPQKSDDGLVVCRR